MNDAVDQIRLGEQLEIKQQGLLPRRESPAERLGIPVRSYYDEWAEGYGMSEVEVALRFVDINIGAV